jgi:SAM-dependent methyltransferase
VAAPSDAEPAVAPENQAQAELWNAPVNRRWATEQERLDAVLDQLDDVALPHAALRPGERVVDIGCGCGSSTLRLARLVGPSGSVLGLDLSRIMLERARERARDLPQVVFEQADASLYPFAGEADLVYSRVGVMFFGDPEAAFANLRRALRPAGRLCIVTWRSWDENPWYQVPMRAAAAVLAMPEPPPKGAPGPQQLAEADRLSAVLRAASFTDIALHPYDVPLRLTRAGLDDAVDFALLAGPLARALFETGNDPAAVARVRAAVREALAEHASGSTVTLGSAFWVATARA